MTPHDIIEYMRSVDDLGYWKRRVLNDPVEIVEGDLYNHYRSRIEEYKVDRVTLSIYERGLQAVDWSGLVAQLRITS